jgi:hypothetical protein
MKIKSVKPFLAIFLLFAMPRIGSAASCSILIPYIVNNTTAVSAVGEAVTSSGMSVRSAINSSADDITDGITKAIAAAADMQKTANTVVSAQIADDSNRKAVGRDLANAASAAGPRYQLPPHDCVTLTGASKVVGAREQAEIISNNLGQGLAYRNLNSKSPKEESRAIFEKHISDYCGPGTAGLLDCEPTSLPDADINVDSLLSGAGLPGKQRDYTFNESQIAAGKAYIKNVIDPLPVKNISPAIANQPAGQEYIVKQMARQGALSLGAKPFVDALAWRTPLKNLGLQLKKIWAQQEKIGISVPAGYQDNFKGDDASPFAFLLTEVDRRAGNPQWLIDMGKSSPEARSTEAAYMQALQLQLSMNALLRYEKIEMLLGGIYAQLVKSDPESVQLQQWHEHFTSPETTN